MCLSGVVVFTATSRAVSALEIKYFFKYWTFQRAARAEIEGGKHQNPVGPLRAGQGLFVVCPEAQHREGPTHPPRVHLLPSLPLLLPPLLPTVPPAAPGGEQRGWGGRAGILGNPTGFLPRLGCGSQAWSSEGLSGRGAGLLRRGSWRCAQMHEPHAPRQLGS